jgi:hypothetical protein
MKITIPRCYKPPGLIIRAKAYYIELNDKGLYLIELGNASATPNTRGALEGYIAEKAVAYFDAKYEKDYLITEERLRNGELDQLATEKRSYFLRKEEIKKFSVSPSGIDFDVRVKGGKADLKLLVASSNKESIQQMAEAIGKR